MDEYLFYLIWSASDKDEIIHFPVLPESIEVSEQTDTKTYTIHGLGEVQGEQVNKLSSIKYSGLFPARWYPFVIKQKNLQRSFDYVELLTLVMRSKKPIRFVFQSPYMKKAFVVPVTITSFEWREKAGSPGDVEYSLTLKRYVEYRAIPVKFTAKNYAAISTASTSASSGNANTNTQMKQIVVPKKVLSEKANTTLRTQNRVPTSNVISGKPEKYTIKSGDTWISIANTLKKYYNGKYMLGSIFQLNNIDMSRGWVKAKTMVGKKLKLP